MEIENHSAVKLARRRLVMQERAAERTRIPLGACDDASLEAAERFLREKGFGCGRDCRNPVGGIGLAPSSAAARGVWKSHRKTDKLTG
ncbi:MAG: hypothetical protein M3494_08335 [Actinomycetota bacterium]|nr:hypothetical protein [Actinomycetota bacterium]